MDNLKRYQICHDLITYFATLIFPKKVIYVLYLGPEVVLHRHMSNLTNEKTSTTRTH